MSRSIFAGSYPFRYLGIPMHHRKLLDKDWKAIEGRVKKLSGWKEKLLSVGRQLVLILSNLPIFMLSFFVVWRGVLKRIEYYRSRFYWQNDQQKKKYRLVKWNIRREPKEQWGHGSRSRSTGLWVLERKGTVGRSLSDGGKLEKNFPKGIHRHRGRRIISKNF